MRKKIKSRTLFDVLAGAKIIAREYYSLTKKPLGITGEVDEYEAARLLDLELAQARKKTFDAVLLVLLTDDFEPTDIHEAKYVDVRKALKKPGSKARNERYSLAISQFISIGARVWSKI